MVSYDVTSVKSAQEAAPADREGCVTGLQRSFGASEGNASKCYDDCSIGDTKQPRLPGKGVCPDYSIALRLQRETTSKWWNDVTITALATRRSPRLLGKGVCPKRNVRSGKTRAAWWYSYRCTVFLDACHRIALLTVTFSSARQMSQKG